MVPPCPRGLCALLLTLLVTVACGDAPEQEAQPADTPASTLVEGACGDVNGSSVCTWARLEGERITEIGARIPMGSVEGADPEAPFLWPPVAAATIPMPDVVRQQMGILDLKVYWESHGHPPGPYLVPHFDYHFYVWPGDRVDAIDCTDNSKPSQLPAGYALPDIDIPELGMLVGLCVPEMGMHALSQAEMESEETFDGTMVVGYYEGEPIFFEPMITRDLMAQQQSFDLAFPEIAGASEGVTLPTRFEAVYDEAGAAYDFVFSGFPMS